jgi:hypothetical protein
LFKEKSLGDSVSYGNKMSRATLIVYDHGQTPIPDGKANELIAHQMKRSIEDLKSAGNSGFARILLATLTRTVTIPHVLPECCRPGAALQPRNRHVYRIS